MSCPTGALFNKGSTVGEMERDRSKLEFIVTAREKKQWICLRSSSPPSGWAAVPAATCRSWTSTSSSSNWPARSDMVFSPIIDVKEYPEKVDVCLVEGAVCNEDNLEMIHKVRRRTQAPRLLRRLRRDRQRARHPQPARPGQRRERPADAPTSRRPSSTRACPRSRASCPPLLDRVMPVHEVVHVDFYLPGCPPPADRIKALLVQVLDGAAPQARRAAAQVWLNRSRSRIRMSKRIVIDPVTRIEGHAKISIFLDDAGNVSRRRVPRRGVPRLREVLRGPALQRDARHHRRASAASAR